MALLNPLSHAFGLDIGDRAFKLTQFKKNRGAYRLTAWGNIDVPDGVLDRGEIKDTEKASALISELIRTSQGRLKGRAVVACLPEAKTFIKIIEIPKNADESGMKHAVLTEIEQNIPLPQEEIYYDWRILPDLPSIPKTAPETPTAGDKATEANASQKQAKTAVPEETQPPEPRQENDDGADEKGADFASSIPHPPTTRILLGAAPKTLVDGYQIMLEKAGLATIALEIEAMAIARALISNKADSNDAIGILDIGATRSSLMIFDGGSVQMSISIPISGIEITRIVSENLKVSMEDAEVLKRECGLDADRCEDKMWKILLPLIDDMTTKIRNALRFYRIGFPAGKKIERLYLCGGGALFREIDTVLSRKLTIKVRRGNPFVNLHPKLPRAFPKDQALPYATAIGLGLDALDENEKYRRSF